MLLQHRWNQSRLWKKDYGEVLGLKELLGLVERARVKTKRKLSN